MESVQLPVYMLQSYSGRHTVAFTTSCLYFRHFFPFAMVYPKRSPGMCQNLSIQALERDRHYPPPER